MPVIFHLSDLHFGPRFNQHLADLILHDINAAQPDLVIVSGDWTMRGRRSEYALAREYLRRLPPPVFTIPGNHDQPLHWGGMADRLLRPWSRFKEYIQEKTDTVLQGPGLFVIGLNDNHNLLPGGVWTRAQRRWMETELRAAPASACKILVMHHQLLWEGKWRPAGQWFPNRTMDRLSQMGVELVLNGHTHIPILRQTARGLVIAQSGTTLSGRTRNGQGNAYNRVEIHPDHFSIAVNQFDPSVDGFIIKDHATFPRHPRTAQ